MPWHNPNHIINRRTEGRHSNNCCTILTSSIFRVPHFSVATNNKITVTQLSVIYRNQNQLQVLLPKTSINHQMTNKSMSASPTKNINVTTFTQYLHTMGFSAIAWIPGVPRYSTKLTMRLLYPSQQPCFITVWPLTRAHFSKYHSH